MSLAKHSGIIIKNTYFFWWIVRNHSHDSTRPDTKILSHSARTFHHYNEKRLHKLHGSVGLAAVTCIELKSTICLDYRHCLSTLLKLMLRLFQSSYSRNTYPFYSQNHSSTARCLTPYYHSWIQPQYPFLSILRSHERWKSKETPLRFSWQRR